LRDKQKSCEVPGDSRLARGRPAAASAINRFARGSVIFAKRSQLAFWEGKKRRILPNEVAEMGIRPRFAERTQSAGVFFLGNEANFAE
jgi:hypothetical protein